jgi:ParB family chromosome partitioning protein
MDIENRLRTDISPYERGRSYSRWLAAGYFHSQEELARELQISRARLSRLIVLAKIPAIVVRAFANPAHLREEWGLRLAHALCDERARGCITRRARSLGALKQRPSAAEVFRSLLSAAAPGPKVHPSAHLRVVRDDDGRPIFRVRHDPTSVTILLPGEHVSDCCLTQMRAAVAEVMSNHCQGTL